MNTQKIEVSFSGSNACWNATINYIDRKISEGYSLPWTPGPTRSFKTPFGEIKAGIGLYDSRNRLVMHCNDQASAEVLSRYINKEFDESSGE